MWTCVPALCEVTHGYYLTESTPATRGPNALTPVLHLEKQRAPVRQCEFSNPGRPLYREAVHVGAGTGKARAPRGGQ